MESCLDYRYTRFIKSNKKMKKYMNNEIFSLKGELLRRAKQNRIKRFFLKFTNGFLITTLILATTVIAFDLFLYPALETLINLN